MSADIFTPSLRIILSIYAQHTVCQPNQLENQCRSNPILYKIWTREFFPCSFIVCTMTHVKYIIIYHETSWFKPCDDNVTKGAPPVRGSRGMPRSENFWFLMLWNAISCISCKKIRMRTVIFIHNIHILSNTYFPIFQRGVGWGGGGGLQPQ